MISSAFPFCDLPDDIQHIVLEHLYATDPQSTLEFSLVSRTARAFCLPMMFRCWTWSPNAFGEGDGLVVPGALRSRDIRRYIRKFTLSLSTSIVPYIEAINIILSAVFPHMPGLRTFCAVSPLSGDWSSLSLLNTLANLTDLQLLDSPLTSTKGRQPIFPRTLTQLTYGARTPPPAEYVQTTVKETRTLSMLLLAHGAQLTHLSLPAQLTMFSFLRSARWPVLQVLELHSYPPIALASDGDIAAFLGATPQLRVLRVDIAHSQTSRAPVVLVPAPDPQPGALPPIFLAALEVLVLRRPDARERITRYLRPALRALDLRAYPHATQFRPTEHVALPPLTSVQVAEIIGLLGGFPGLHVLRIAVGAPFGEDLVRMIVRVCPGLEILEIQELRQQEVEVDAYARTNIFAHTLSELNTLKELRLQDLVYDKTPGDMERIAFPPRPDDIRESPLYGVAHTLAQGLPSLRRVVFLGGYECTEVCRIGVRQGVVEEYWQVNDDK